MQHCHSCHRRILWPRPHLAFKSTFLYISYRSIWSLSSFSTVLFCCEIILSCLCFLAAAAWFGVSRLDVTQQKQDVILLKWNGAHVFFGHSYTLEIPATDSTVFTVRRYQLRSRFSRQKTNAEMAKELMKCANERPTEGAGSKTTTPSALGKLSILI